MLLRTRGLIDIYLKQLKKSLKILTFSAQIFSIVYLALMLLLGSGVWMVNIVLLALCVSSIVFDILTYDKKDKKTKKIRKKTKKNN